MKIKYYSDDIEKVFMESHFIINLSKRDIPFDRFSLFV